MGSHNKMAQLCTFSAGTVGRYQYLGTALDDKLTINLNKILYKREQSQTVLFEQVEGL